jgi:hypothetical protein
VDVVKFAWPKGSTTVSDLVGGFTEFGFGARVWGALAKGFDVYYDDIAMGASRLGPVEIAKRARRTFSDRCSFI